MMGWAAGVTGAGGAVLVLGCAIGMGLLIWLLFRLTGTPTAPVGAQPERQVLDQRLPEGRIDADTYVRARPRPRIDEHPPSVPGSGSVAP